MADGEYRRLGCAATGCDGIHKAQGYCLRHYRQWQRGGVKQDATRCAHCGSPIAGLRGKMYCSQQCKHAAWVAVNPDRWQELNASRSCAYFGLYCRQCGQPFGSRRQRAYCSERCESSAWYVANRVSIAAPERACRSCGLTFATKPFRTRPTDFCSDPCKRAAVRAQKDKRKALERGATVETVNPIKVFQRDGWRCRLCGVKTPIGKRGTYADDAPELDHILPLSKGGEHSYRNTQCACRRCNGLKGDRPLGQLLLVG